MIKVIEVKELEEDEIKAIVVNEYLKLFCEFEKFLKGVFLTHIEKVEDSYSHDKLSELNLPEDSNKLIAINKYSRMVFFLGALKGTQEEPDYQNNKSVTRTLVFKKGKGFKKLSLNEMIKMDEIEKFIPVFNTPYPVKGKVVTEYPFHTCCRKLIKLRTDLAHESLKDDFDERSIIHTFNYERLQGFDIVFMRKYNLPENNNYILKILSNYVIMDYLYKNILEKIKSENS